MAFENLQALIDKSAKIHGEEPEELCQDHLHQLAHSFVVYTGIAKLLTDFTIDEVTEAIAKDVGEPLDE